jgi:putative ABC transport system permease protein
VGKFEKWFAAWLDKPLNPLGTAVLVLAVVVGIVYWEQTRFLLKSLRRNPLRTLLTGMATAVLVMVVTLVWSILSFLDKVTEAKTQDLKAIITERYQIPSMMPDSYSVALMEGAARKPGDYRINPEYDAMTWAFYGGTLDPKKKTRENIVFFFSMEPRKLCSVDKQGNFHSMMDGLDEVSDEDKRKLAEACAEMERSPHKVLIGSGRLAAMGKKVGERIKVTSLNYQDIDLEFEILGVLPGGRYEQSAIMNYQYLRNALDSYKKSKRQAHPMDDKSLALVWVRVPSTRVFEQVAEQVTESPEFKTPAVKAETASSGIASFLDAYRDLLWGMRWLLVPAILCTMALVIANAISISVRERRIEMAVLKVLGFTPTHILGLVLGEALLIGCGSGLLSALVTKVLINDVIGGVALPIAFFGKFFIAAEAPWWGLAIGGLTSFAGSIVPAWSARSVKVSEVFSRIS